MQMTVFKLKEFHRLCKNKVTLIVEPKSQRKNVLRPNYLYTREKSR
jgi:hypothetical protein